MRKKICYLFKLVLFFHYFTIIVQGTSLVDLDKIKMFLSNIVIMCLKFTVGHVVLASVNNVPWTDGARNTSLFVNMPAAFPVSIASPWVCAQWQAENTDALGWVGAGLLTLSI